MGLPVCFLFKSVCFISFLVFEASENQLSAEKKVYMKGYGGCNPSLVSSEDGMEEGDSGTMVVKPT